MPGSKPVTAQARWVWWGVAGITVLAAVLRAYRIDHGGLWYDELIMARITSGTWSAWWSEVLLGRPPIYPALGILWADWFGQSDAAMRSLSAVFGVVAVPLVYLVGRRLFDWRVGLVGAVLIAVSPYQVYYSQEHRYYALFLVFCLLSVWLLLRALGVGDARDNEATPGESATAARPWTWAGYIASSVLAFYTHSFALFLLPAIGLAVLAMYGRSGLGMARMKVFLITQVAIIGLILPWGLMKMALAQRAAAGAAAENGALVTPWITSPPWWAPVRTAGNFLFLGLKYVSLPWAAAAAGVLLVGVVVAISRGGGISRWTADTARAVVAGWRQSRGGWWIALAWTVGPLLLVLLLSYAIRPIYNDRYLMASTAGLYLMVAACMVALMRVIPMWAMMGLILMGMAGSLGTYYEKPDKGAWAEAAAWLDENRIPGEALAFSSERDIGRENANVRANWFWYAQTGADQEHLVIQVKEELSEVVRDLKSASAPYAGVWLVMWRDPDQTLGLEESFADGPLQGLELAETKKFFDLTLLRFERTDGQVELADSKDGPIEPVDPGIQPDPPNNKSPLITR